MSVRNYDPEQTVVDIITGDIIKVSDYTGLWFSASLLEDNVQCPAKAYARLTKQPQLNPGIALINGIAAHRGMELFLKERKDPIKTFVDTFKIECEKQKFPWTSEEAQQKLKEGEKMLAAARERYGGESFLSGIDPNLVEVGFKIMRGGRMFVGKMDLIYFRSIGRYNVVDFKTGKNPPSQFELDNDLQFLIYPWAAYHSKDLPTYELWPQSGVWDHLRGKDVTPDPETGLPGTKKIYYDAKAKPKVVIPRQYQYDFRTKPSKEYVDLVFTDTIDPACQEIEDRMNGDLPIRRNRSNDCKWCGWFNKDKQQCGAQLPADGLAERSSQISLGV